MNYYDLNDLNYNDLEPIMIKNYGNRDQEQVCLFIRKQNSPFQTDLGMFSVHWD